LLMTHKTQKYFIKRENFVQQNLLKEHYKISRISGTSQIILKTISCDPSIGFFSRENRVKKKV